MDPSGAVLRCQYRPRRATTAEQRASLKHRGATDPIITTAVDLAADFLVMVRHSNGQTAGQVLRLKLITRQGSGRANCDRLRQRVLRAA